jgi:hypothetical protein
MDTLSDLAYEMLLAYGVPGGLSLIPYLIYLSKVHGIRWDLDLVGQYALSFAVLSVIAGLLLDMIAVAVTTKVWRFQQDKRNNIFFGSKGKRKLLWRLIADRYPNETRDDDSDDDRAALVYAIFNDCVSEYVFSRRNYDWYFAMFSRNIVVTYLIPSVGLGLVAHAFAWPIAWVGLALLIAGGLFAVLRLFMFRQIEIYYGYYANVVLGHLLKQPASAAPPPRSLAKPDPV